MRCLVTDFERAFHREAGKGFHRGSIYVFPSMLAHKNLVFSQARKHFVCQTHVKSHPRDGFVVINASSLDQVQGQGLIIELKREYSTRWGPRSDHEVVKHGKRMGRGAKRVVYWP
jgi:hypothetical protein